jgi:phosphatidate cytidylyltransferase
MARPKQHDGQTGDLGIRLASAAILIPFALFVVYQGGALLAAACALFAALMAYEWIRMTASPSMKAFVTLAILPFIAAVFGGLAWAVLVLLLAALVVSFLHPVPNQRGAEVRGFLYVSGMALALYMLRAGPWDGVPAALMIMGIVWGSDSAAYFVGRSLRGPLLHPDSPSKTWSGAIGAVLFSAGWGILAAHLSGGNVVLWVIAGGVISVVAQIGDLIESSTKRSFGVKDASAMVPGHGGLLDRVDGLGMVCIASVLVFLFAPALVRGLGLAI